MTNVDATAWRWVTSSESPKQAFTWRTSDIRSWLSNWLTKQFGFGPLAKKTLKNFGFNSAAQFISKGGAIFFTIIIARLLHPEGYGLYVLALSVASITLTFADLGINNALIRYVAAALGENNTSEARNYFRYLFKFKLLLASILAISLIFLAKPISLYLFHKPDLILLLQIAAIFVFTQAIMSYFESAFKAHQEFKYFTLSQGVWQSLRLAIAPTLVILGFSVGGAIFGLAIATLCVAILIGYLLYKKHHALIKGPTIDFNKSRLHYFLKWICISVIASEIFAYIDKIMIGSMLPIEQAGYYGAAWAVLVGISGLASGASGALYPLFSQLKKENLRAAFTKSIKLSLALSIPTTIGVAFLAKYIILVLYGAEYVQAIAPLRVLSLIVIISTSAILFKVLLEAEERVDITTKLFLIAVVINIILNYLLISWIGITGAAIATVISLIALYGGCGLIVKQVLS